MLTELLGLDPVFEWTLLTIVVVVPLIIVVKIIKWQYSKGAEQRVEEEKQQALQERANNPVHCFDCKKVIPTYEEENECGDCGETFCPTCYEKGSEGYCAKCTEDNCTFEVVIVYDDDEETVAEEMTKQEAEKLVSDFKNAMTLGHKVFEYDGTIYQVEKIRKVYYQ